MKNLAFITIAFLLLYSCSQKKELPFYGKKVINGESVTQQVPAFNFTDQKNEAVSAETFKDDIYVVDFFFTSCPSICPIMTKNMVDVYKEFKENGDVKIMSVSIDPKRDTVEQLNAYALKSGIEDNDTWHFVTGEKDDIYDLAKFFSILAYEDSTVPGGFEHNGYFLLVDKNKYIRGYYDGTRDEEIPKIIDDIHVLLDER
ncbi:MAG: SCO family protein [Chitinophagales bacterium]|nr:SCO family protein [Chitinophagales bacterium]